MSVPKVEDPDKLLSSLQVKEIAGILQKMFAGYRLVIIEKELGGGFSGGRIFVVRPFREQGAELPVVIKMAPTALIEKERRAYKTYIRNRLPNTARIQESVYSAEGTWAGLRYSLIGGGVFEIESLYQYLLRAEVDLKKANFTLKERLFESMGLLWRANEARQGFQFRGSYDPGLPVNLVIASLEVTRTLPSRKKTPRLTPETATQYDFRAGDYVFVSGFEVIEVESYEVEPDQKVVTLSSPRSQAGQPNAYRLRLQLAQAESLADYQVGQQPSEAIIGQIVTTRFEILQELAQQTLGHAIDLTLETVPLTLLGKTITLPNPLMAWSDILNHHFDVRVAHAIHGDLNLQNILVDPKTGDVSLIDFADARQDHVLHDLLRLETEVVTHLLPLALNQAGLSSETIYTFYMQLHCATFQTTLFKSTWVPPDLEKPFTILETIRQTARRYLFNYDDCAEYYQGLTIYLLGALKFRNLDRGSKQLAFWGAATVQELLTGPPQAESDWGQEEIIQGRWGLKAVIRKLLSEHTLRLQVLKGQKAGSGRKTPDEIRTDVFELEMEIEKLQTELQEMGDGQDSIPYSEITQTSEVHGKTQKYKRESKIGTGEIGEVWLATDTSLNRPVAIKYIQATDDLPSKELFLMEARVLTRLNHPNITAIYEAVFDERRKEFFLVMEYVDGKTLSTIIAETYLLPLDVILDIALNILRALSHAHRQGIVHGDIKPANVLMVNDEVKLTDFGIANLISLLEKDTDFRAGSSVYLAPEQIEGHPADGRADLYALGVMLFEMITGGHLPFGDGDKQTSIKAHLHPSPIPVSTFSPNVSPILEYIIMRLLAKNPEDRYPSADVLLNVLSSIHAQQKLNQPYLQLLDHDLKPFVGLTNELNRIEAVWEEAKASDLPHLVVLRGRMGIGKSRLVAEFLRNSIIDKGFVGVVGRCDEFGAPYTPYGEILTTIFNTGFITSESVEEELGQIQGHIPDLASLLNIDTTTLAKETPKDPKLAQWLFFEAMLVVLAKLGPAVIFLENAAFLDEASIALTRHLVRHGRNLPLLLIAGCRDEGSDIPWLSSFQTDEPEVIGLQPLPAASIKEYLIHLMAEPVSDAVVSVVHERSDGIPFYIETVTASLIEVGGFSRDDTGEWRYTQSQRARALPPILKNILAQRLERLTEKSHQTLAVAANIGSAFDFETWVAVLGGKAKMDLALSALDEALGMGILRDAGANRYIFHPPDIASILAFSLPVPRQRYLHRQIGGMLRDKRERPSLIAHHYQLAELSTETVRYLEQAGAQAMAANAINQATDYYKKAIVLGPSPSNYEALGNLYRQKGAWKEAIQAFGQALALVKKAKDRSSQAQILNGLSFVLAMSDHYSEANEAAESVLNLPNILESERANAQSHLGMVAYYSGWLMKAEYWCQAAVETLRQVGDEVSLAGAYNRLGLVYFARSKMNEAVAMFDQALEIRRKLNDYWGQAYCLNNLGKVATDRGAFAQAQAHFGSAQQLFEKIDSIQGLMEVYTNQGRAMLDQGQVNKALAILSKALEQAKKLGKPSSYVLGDIYLLIAQAHLQGNELSRARTATNEALKLVEVAGNQEHMATVQGILAQIQAAEGDHVNAELLFQKTLVMFAEVGNPTGLLRTRWKYAQFLAVQGRTEEASKVGQTARDAADRLGLHL